MDSLHVYSTCNRHAQVDTVRSVYTVYIKYIYKKNLYGLKATVKSYLLKQNRPPHQFSLQSKCLMALS